MNWYGFSIIFCLFPQCHDNVSMNFNENDSKHTKNDVLWRDASSTTFHNSITETIHNCVNIVNWLKYINYNFELRQNPYPSMPNYENFFNFSIKFKSCSIFGIIHLEKKSSSSMNSWFFQDAESVWNGNVLTNTIIFLNKTSLQFFNVECYYFIVLFLA